MTSTFLYDKRTYKLTVMQAADVHPQPAEHRDGVATVDAAFDSSADAAPAAGSPVTAELASIRAELVRLRAENARLVRLLKLSPREAESPGPEQSAIFEAPPGPVHAASTPMAKVAFFRALLAARTDVYAARWENDRTGRSGWLPAVRGGWRKGIKHGERDYLPLTDEVITAHLSREMHLGLYPLLDGDRCWWLAADFDGPAAMLDALAYLKAARAEGVPRRWKCLGQDWARMHGCSSPPRDGRDRSSHGHLPVA